MSAPDDNTPAWRQIAVTTTHTALVELVFEQHGATAITALDAGGMPTVELTPHAQPDFGLTRMVGLFPLATPVDAIRRDLLQALGTDVVIEVNDLADKNWRQAWVAHHPPLHFGGRLWVAPHGVEIDAAAADAIIVRLDPGLAFGTGTHPTTALCLDWLARADLSGRTVLDYGCGSGILAIAAVSRVILLFPALAIGAGRSLSDILEMSRPIWLRLTILIFASIVLTTLLSWPLTWLMEVSASPVAAVIPAFLSTLVSAYGVAVISCAYRTHLPPKMRQSGAR